MSENASICFNQLSQAGRGNALVVSKEGDAKLLEIGGSAAAIDYAQRAARAGAGGRARQPQLG